MSRPRAPGYAFGSLTFVLLLLLAIVSLTQRTPPPPTIAEFAPQAIENISDAPSDQSSSSGRSGGDGGAGGGTFDPTPSPPPAIDVPRVRRCVGDPPRQIEDSQAPPCVPYWTGNNGGATYKGVTGDEIRVAFPGIGTSDASRAELSPAEQSMETFFNRRFEFYGRTMRLKKIVAAGCDSGGNPDTALINADAVNVDENVRAFASASYCQVDSVEQFYYDELTRRKVLSVAGLPVSFGEARYADSDPYQWNYVPPLDVMEKHIADWTCRGLAGRPARYGRSDPTTRRSFGLAYSTPAGQQPLLEPLREALGRCGVTFAAEVALPHDPFANDQFQAAALKLRQSGVTTILSLMQTADTAFLMRTASNQAWFPEWYVSSFFLQDEESLARLFWPGEQAAHVFGISFYNRNLPLGEEPVLWAIKEIDPTFSYSADDAGNGRYDTDRQAYKSLLVLASGIQMAGPKLSPETFRAGLVRTAFPNPGAGAAPYYQSRIGFGATDHAGNEDGTIFWYSPSARNPTGHAGALCYLHSGVRFTTGTYPATDDGLFGPSCP